MGGISVMLLLSFFVFFIVILAAIVLYCLISYIFESIAIMRLSGKNAAAAWIPFYNRYLLGKIADNRVMGGIAGVLAAVSFCLGISLLIPWEGEPLVLPLLVACLTATFILDTIVAHLLYTRYSEKYGDLFTIFTALTLGLLRPFFLFAIRNKVVANT